MSSSNLSRRQFLGRSVVGLTVLATGASTMAACGGGSDEPNCATPSGLDSTQQGLRTSLHYVDRAPDAAKQCQKCSFYTAAPSADACGGCTLNLGPVSPLGTCNSFSPKT